MKVMFLCVLGINFVSFNRSQINSKCALYRLYLPDYHYILIRIICYINLGPSWLWSYGSWIYIYLCNRPNTTNVGEAYSIQHFVIKCHWFAVGQCFFFFMYTGFLHQEIWPPRYNWNIVESGVNHHKGERNISWVCY